MMSNKLAVVKKYVSKMDLFSTPLQFTLGPEDRVKKTLFGGMITLSIMVLSLSYLIYISILYFSKSILPSISTTYIQLDNDYEINISEDLFGFKVRVGNEDTIQNIEQKIGKRVLSYFAVYSYYKGEELNYIGLTVAPCKSEKLQGYLCVEKSYEIDDQEFKLQFKYYDQIKVPNKILIYFMKCNQSFIQKGEECVAEDFLVQELLYHPSTQLEFKTILRKFNPLSKEYEEMNKLESLIFDDNLTYVRQLSYINIQTRVIDGFLIQSTEIENNLSEYYRSDTYVSKSKFLKQTQNEVHCLLGLDLSPNATIQSVQYEQFTTVLAQFFSVLQFLLFFGIICSSFSQMEIIQDLLNLQLKVYYKKTALDIIKQSDKSRKTNYEQLNQYQLLQSIQDSDIKTKITNYTKLGFIQRLKIFLSSKRKTLNEEIGSKEVKTYKTLLKKSMKSIDIYHIQQELLKIQMMLRLIFSAEQYAAIQLCGCSVLRENQNVKIDNQNGQNILPKQNDQTEHIKLNIQELEDATKKNKQQDINQGLQNNQNNDNKSNNDKNNINSNNLQKNNDTLITSNNNINGNNKNNNSTFNNNTINNTSGNLNNENNSNKNNSINNNNNVQKNNDPLIPTNNNINANTSNNNINANSISNNNNTNSNLNNENNSISEKNNSINNNIQKNNDILSTANNNINSNNSNNNNKINTNNTSNNINSNLNNDNNSNINQNNNIKNNSNQNNKNTNKISNTTITTSNNNNNNQNNKDNNNTINKSNLNNNNTNIKDENNKCLSPKQIKSTTEQKVYEQDIENHLEIIEQIENDKVILQQYVDKFINYNKVPQSELDKRIIQSMIGINNTKQQKQHKS